MCFHKRLIFPTCNHSAFLFLTRPCAVEQAFARGEVDVGCSSVWSHGYDTIRVSGLICPQCAERKAKEDVRVGEVKERLRGLREKLGLGKVGGSESQGEGEKDGSESAGSGSVPPGSGSGSGSVSADEMGERISSEEDGDSDDEFANEVMEEVRYDPDHRSFKLPVVIAERKAEELAKFLSN